MVPPTNVRRPQRDSSTAGDSGAELTRRAVIEVALSLADANGLDSVTIRGLAQHFGVTPMALYWHVKNKDELLAAMGDEIFAGVVLPDATGLAWDEHYRLLLVALLKRFRAHPGAVDLAGARVLQNVAGLDLTERALSLLRGAGLSVRASADIARSSMQTMMMLVSLQPGVERSVPAPERLDLLARKAAVLAGLPVMRYPNLVECAAALVDCDDENCYYRDGLELFLAGVKAQVAAAVQNNAVQHKAL